jgi:hypothetical protein
MAKDKKNETSETRETEGGYDTGKRIFPYFLLLSPFLIR